ncbi:hypothetical protein PENSPDRAFT_596014 [Peniophora sp. CONT]|nr:hypothetical protein PENSPDRAFT_596014 [Peniophora sp. CONT]
MRVIFLPPYSPDFNPIEIVFSELKRRVRREQVLGRHAQDIDDGWIYDYLYDIAYNTITPNHASGYFHHCSYL